MKVRARLVAPQVDHASKLLLEPTPGGRQIVDADKADRAGFLGYGGQDGVSMQN